MASFNRIAPNTLEVTGDNGNAILYNKVALNGNGLPISDADVDGVTYIKQGYEYFKKGDVAEAVIPDPTFTDDSFDI